MEEKFLALFVVDDDESVRTALKRLLRSNGFQVITFESAEEFLSAARGEGCLILDICLPGMSGLELYERLASSGVRYAVIFMTAHDNPQWQERAGKAGAVAYLRKPFDQRALLDAIHLACSR